MTQAPSMVCPNCGQSDQIQKVRAIVGGDSIASKSDHALYFAERTRTESRLTSRLSLVKEPERPNRWSDYREGLTLPKARGCGCVGTIVVMIILGALIGAWGVGYIVSLNSTSPFELEEQGRQFGQTRGWYIENAVVCFVIAFLLVALPLLYPVMQRWLRKREDFRRMKFLLASQDAADKAEAAYEASHRRWENARQLWVDDLYYCHRDDVVFLPSSQAVMPEDMMRILT